LISGYLKDIKIITIIQGGITDNKIPRQKEGNTFHRGSNPYIHIKIQVMTLVKIDEKL
jgi:hypothetical protein